MIWLILAITLGLRVIGLDQSLWLDEAISANVAKLPITQIIGSFSVGDFHPPVYYWFLDGWVKIFGGTVVAMRLSSVLFSLVTVFGVYKIGEKLKNKRLGLWVAWFTAINPLMIYYGQELRMYAMMTMWSVWAIYFWMKLIRGNKNSTIDWVLFNIFIFLAFVTFYGSVFLTGAMILYFLVRKNWKSFGKSMIGIMAAIVVISPLLVGQLKMSHEALGQVINWSLVLGKVNLKNLLLIPFKFSIGRISWYPKNFYYLIGGLWSMLVWWVAWKNGRKEKGWIWLMIMPLVLGIIFSLKSPMIQYFRFLYLVPIMALGMAGEKKKWLKIVLSIGFLGFSGWYLFNPAMYREDWKSLVNQLESWSVNRIYMVESFSDPIKFYNPKIKVVDIRSEILESKVWIAPYGEVIHGVNHKNILGEKGYKLEKQINFREIELEEWSKNKSN